MQAASFMTICFVLLICSAIFQTEWQIKSGRRTPCCDEEQSRQVSGVGNMQAPMDVYAFHPDGPWRPVLRTSSQGPTYRLASAGLPPAAPALLTCHWASPALVVPPGASPCWGSAWGPLQAGPASVRPSSSLVWRHLPLACPGPHLLGVVLSSTGPPSSGLRPVHLGPAVLSVALQPHCPHAP